jgi:competence protein ComEA
MLFHATHNSRAWLIAGAVILVSSGLAAASRPTVSVTVQQAQDPALADQNYPLFVRVCGNCHDSQRVVASRRSKVDWEDVINTMIAKGAEGTDQDFEAVLQYLLHHYGKVYVNRCVASELVTILELSQKDADAIVAYRKEKGNFADFDALTKVPGIDTKALEAHKDAIVF